MANNVFADLIDTVVDFKADVFRNISTVITSEDLLDDLSDEPEERAYGESIVSEQAYSDELSFADHHAALYLRSFFKQQPLCPDPDPFQ